MDPERPLGFAHVVIRSDRVGFQQPSRIQPEGAQHVVRVHDPAEIPARGKEHLAPRTQPVPFLQPPFVGQGTRDLPGVVHLGGPRPRRRRFDQPGVDLDGLRGHEEEPQPLGVGPFGEIRPLHTVHVERRNVRAHLFPKDSLQALQPAGGFPPVLRQLFLPAHLPGRHLGFGIHVPHFVLKSQACFGSSRAPWCGWSGGSVSSRGPSSRSGSGSSSRSVLESRESPSRSGSGSSSRFPLEAR